MNLGSSLKNRPLKRTANCSFRGPSEEGRFWPYGFGESQPELPDNCCRFQFPPHRVRRKSVQAQAIEPQPHTQLLAERKEWGWGRSGGTPILLSQLLQEEPGARRLRCGAVPQPCASPTRTPPARPRTPAGSASTARPGNRRRPGGQHCQPGRSRGRPEHPQPAGEAGEPLPGPPFAGRRPPAGPGTWRSGTGRWLGQYLSRLEWLTV